MNTVLRRWLIHTIGFVVLAGFCGCVATGPGYERGGYAVGYDEPYGSEYGAWGAGYHVAPPRRGERRSEEPAHHTYRAAPRSRPTPSLPTRSRDHSK